MITTHGGGGLKGCSFVTADLFQSVFIVYYGLVHIPDDIVVHSLQVVYPVVCVDIPILLCFQEITITIPRVMLMHFFQAVQNILFFFFLSVDDVRTDLDHAKKEKRRQQTLKMSMPSPESSTNSKRDDRRKDGKCRMPTSPEEKKLVTDQITEQLLSNGSKSQACVLL